MPGLWRKKFYPQEDQAQQDEQHRPILADQPPAAQEGGEDGEQHQAVEQHPTAGTDDALAPFQQAGEQGAHPGKAGDQRPGISPTGPVPGGILPVQQATHAGHDGSWDNHTRHPKQQTQERQQSSGANDGDRPGVGKRNLP